VRAVSDRPHPNLYHYSKPTTENAQDLTALTFYDVCRWHKK